MLTRSTPILFIALVFSLVLHIGAVFYLKDRPMGHIDIEAMRNERRVLLVRRSPDDVITLPENEDPDVDASDADPDKPRPLPSLTALSQAMLMDPSTNPFPIAAPEGGKVKLQQPDPERKIDFDEGEIEVTLPESLHERFVEAEPPALPMAEGDADPNLGASNSFGGDNAESGASRATALLEDAGFLPGHNPLPATRPPVVEANPQDRRVIEAPFADPKIDFAGVALEGTKNLNIPEHLDSDFDYKLTVFEDRKAREEPFNYFEIEVSAKRSLRKLKTMPKDVVFLLDISESVPQDYVQQMIRGVWFSQASFNEGDRFNIVLFNDQAAVMNPAGPIAATEDNWKNMAEPFLRDVAAVGFTDMNRALSRLLVRDVDIERVYDIILISDGRPTRGVVDSREVINLITKDNDLNASIYCVTVGPRPDSTMMEFLAYRNRGFNIEVNKVHECADTIVQLMSRLRYPIMKDVKLSTVGLDRNDVYPIFLPNVHQNESFKVYGVYRRPTDFRVRIAGHNGEKALDLTAAFDLTNAERGTDKISTDWAFWKLHHLYSQIIARESSLLRKQIEELGKRYDLQTLY